ncbi:MAG: ABC transporter permease [Anaerolineae bacterium]|nr:ABC transporter permease [Anaerolineae bacterium]MBN8618056.1 ABC transporter permease [Anaerolineae bacterium]
MTTLNDTSKVSSQVATIGEKTYAKGQSNFSRSVRRLRKHRMALFGALLLIGVVLFVLIGSMLITEAQANFNNPANRLRDPSSEHPFGTDVIGRDLLARVVYGGQISLFVGVTAVIVQMLVGTLVGVLAGYMGGVVDSLLMRFAEAMLSIPQLFLALVALRIFADPSRFPDFQFMGRVFSSTLVVIVFVIGLTSWMRVARIVRSVVLALKEQEFVTAARSIGARSYQIILSHILPNCIAPIIVSATLGVASAILLEAYLGFLGLGVRAPTPTWGNIMGEANAYIGSWYYWFFPALFIILTTLGINFFGDGLRDALDPKSLN